MEYRIKRTYDGADPADGVRILVDRLWPRGISKDMLNVAFWAKDLSPSNELRKWYDHDPHKWEEFKARYFQELDGCPQALADFKLKIGNVGLATLVFSSKEPALNNAAALKLYLETR
ncbi:MAG: DUF488 domain-containing protein [Ignavibacteriales bacterium]